MSFPSPTLNILFVNYPLKSSHWVKLGAEIAQLPTDMDFGRTFVGLDPDGHRLRIYKLHQE